MSSWRCRRLAVDASIGTGYLKYFWRYSRYLAVQEASSPWEIGIWRCRRQAACSYLDRGTG